MTIEGIEFINSCLDELKIPFEFKEWTSDVPETYWVTDYLEVESMNEDGMEESTFILTGNTLKSKMELESVKEKVKKYFGNEGITAILPSGSGIAVSFSTGNYIPSIDHSVHRLEINLEVKEWKV